jgi:two-component system OmpR family response regulator
MKKELVAAKCGAWERILLVDDDPDIGALVSLILGRLDGYTVQVCGSSIDALERARSFRPDVILLDVTMPGVDGPDILKALRADETTASIPVIFISAGIDRHDPLQYTKLGALGVIPKPFDPGLLHATLQRIRGGQPDNEADPTDLRDLRASYLTSFPEKIAAMEAAAATLVTGGWRKPTVEALYHLAHRMAGLAGLFGLDNVARAAGILGSRLKRLLDDPCWPPSASAAELATLVRAVAAAAPGRARSARRVRQTHVHA